MGWKDRLRTASFRGVEFGVEDTEDSTGSRGSSHEFPKKDDGFFEPLGKKTTIHQVNAFVIGDNYDVQRDRLKKALLIKDPGLLVHPLYGEIFVQCLSVNVKQGLMSDTGMAKFTISFIESGRVPKPIESRDSVQAVNNAVTAIKVQATSEFVSSWTISGAPQGVLNAAETAVNLIADNLNVVFDNLSEQADSVAQLGFTIKKIKRTVADLVQKPDQIAEQFSFAYSTLATALGTDKKSVLKAVQLADKSLASESTLFSTASNNQVNSNNRALESYNRRLLTYDAIAKSAEVKFRSYEDAIESRERLLENLELDLDSSETSLEMYDLTYQLATELKQSVPGPNQSLAKLKTFTLKEVTPSLVVAFDLYGNLDKEEELIEQNNVSNPLFFPSGKILEAFSE